MNASSVFASTTVADVLRFAGYKPTDDPKKLMCCPLPGHCDGTPSFRAFERGWTCFGCSRHGGVADLVVALGKARDRASAARWLEARR
jgi:hypothetical protein